MLVTALLFILPMGAWMRALAVLAVVLVLAFAWWWAGQQNLKRQRALSLADGMSLPPLSYRQPVVLVCGDSCQALFGRKNSEGVAMRIAPQGCYLSVINPEQLPQMVESLLVHRPHWAGQLCVQYIVNPGEHTDAAALAGRLRAFRHQLVLARRCGAALPLLLTTYLQTALGSSPWFTWEHGERLPRVHEASGVESLKDWQVLACDPSEGSARLSGAVRLDCAAAWLAEYVQVHLLSRELPGPAGRAVVQAVMQVSALPAQVAGSLWQQWLHHKAQINGPARTASSGSTLPFPDPLLPLLPISSQETPRRRAGLLALWLFTAAALVAMCSSAWQNNLLARQVSDDLRRYFAIPLPEHRDQPEFSLREAAVKVLRGDANRLDGYYRFGEPFQLGLGLYQGERLRVPVLDAISGYRQPPESPVAIEIPNPVRLDSLSLFAVGSSQLKPDSTKVLINALVDIKAQPGWLIVIAGHTDATGNPEKNLELSRARAGAVRDWMQRMGDIPDSCFAVQGFGANQPIASNDTEIGRAANRRVDIRLVPEVGACAPITAAPDRKHQSHSAAFNL